MGTKSGVWAAVLLIGSGAGLLAWQQAKKPSKPAPAPLVADARPENPSPAEAPPAASPSRSEPLATPSEHTETPAADHSLTSASPSPVATPNDISERSFKPKELPAPEAAHSTFFPEPAPVTPPLDSPPAHETASAVTPPPVVEPTPTPTPEVVKETPITHVSTPPASAPAEASKVVTHVVVLGETYSSIAQKYYGSTKYANMLVKANPGKDPRKLQPGNKLNIPEGPRREASGTPKEVTPDASSERVHTPTGSAPPVAADRAYTVKPGETWHVLAQRFLGDSKRWPELYEMNAERAPRNPDGLRAGTVIELPAGIKPTTKPS